jgi:hypothetical protein
MFAVEKAKSNSVLPVTCPFLINGVIFALSARYKATTTEKDF